MQIKEFPEKVILFCEVPPPEGGETPFVPSFRVTERALQEFPEMVEELDAKGLRYTLTAHGAEQERQQIHAGAGVGGRFWHL
jgi:hypothetical protein